MLKKFICIVTVSVFFLVSSPLLYAADQPDQSEKQTVSLPQQNDTGDKQLVEALTKRTAVLESQLKSLKKEIRAMRGNATLKTKKSADGNQTSARTASSAPATADTSAAPARGKVFPLNLLSDRPLYIGGVPVVTSPYFGSRSEFDASDLTVNMSSVNEDLQLLIQRERIMNYYKVNNFLLPRRPIVILSGKIEAQALAANRLYGFDNPRGSDIDLTGSELDVVAIANSWTTGFLTIAFDNSGLGPLSPRRIDNSRLYVDKAFIVLGNLDKIPLYFSIGQMYTPFGQFSTNMVSNPLTKVLFRLQERAALLGFFKKLDASNTLNSSIFTFKGNSMLPNGINQFGANLEYAFAKNNWGVKLAGSFISNVADALGQQHNGNSGTSTFDGFATSPDTEMLVYKVPGLDARASINISDFTFISEYIATTKPFSAANITFNGEGARLQALHLEGVYNFKIFTKPSLIALGYDSTTEALAFLVPKQRYSATVSTAIFKDTILSLEYRHDIDYPTSAVAFGQPGLGLSPLTGTGLSSDMVTLQLGVYF